jgi:hypothetical protein
MNDLLHKPIYVNESDELDIVDDLLHDESFDLSAVQFDQTKYILTIPVRRQFHSGPERCIGDGTLYKLYEKEWMRSIVIIHGVHSWEIHDDQGIESYTFSSWSFADCRITIESNQTLILTIKVDRLEIIVADTGFLGKARIERSPAGAELSSSTVYD